MNIRKNKIKKYIIKLNIFKNTYKQFALDPVLLKYNSIAHEKNLKEINPP